MIGRLKGRLLECGPGEVLLDVGGVGYSLRIPLSTYYALAASPNGSVSLHVHTHVREDALLLYGFSTAEEREVFERLVAISGVGPRIALAVLSGIGAADLERAVLDGDRERLQRIPGIGRKTAERILLELRDRLEREARPARTPAPSRRGPAGEVASDAVSALVNLGYTREASERAVKRALSGVEGEAGLEVVLKRALQGLVR